MLFDVLHSQCCVCLHFLQVHGPWGDAIPQDEGVYCLWAMLEFQDPPEFNYGQSNTNTSHFDGIFGNTVSSVASHVPAGGVLAVAATAGYVAAQDSDGIPWPIASIIWKSGNKYAKPWIEDHHRPYAQVPGYNIGFTFHGHFKAVKCETILPAFESNGLNVTGDFDVYSSYFMMLKNGNFRKYWNAFSDVVDLSDQFVENECVSACELGPCPDSYEAPAETSAAGVGSRAFSTSLGFALLVSGIADLLL